MSYQSHVSQSPTAVRRSLDLSGYQGQEIPPQGSAQGPLRPTTAPPIPTEMADPCLAMAEWRCHKEVRCGGGVGIGGEEGLGRGPCADPVGGQGADNRCIVGLKDEQSTFLRLVGRKRSSRGEVEPY
jgi:hypothetical protein